MTAMEDWQEAEARLHRRVPMWEMGDDGGGLWMGMRQRVTTVEDWQEAEARPHRRGMGEMCEDGGGGLAV